MGIVDRGTSGALDQVLVEQSNSVEQAWQLSPVAELTVRLTRQCQIRMWSTVQFRAYDPA